MKIDKKFAIIFIIILILVAIVILIYFNNTTNSDLFFYASVDKVYPEENKILVEINSDQIVNEGSLYILLGTANIYGSDGKAIKLTDLTSGICIKVVVPSDAIIDTTAPGILSDVSFIEVVK